MPGAPDESRTWSTADVVTAIEATISIFAAEDLAREVMREIERLTATGPAASSPKAKQARARQQRARRLAEMFLRRAPAAVARLRA